MSRPAVFTAAALFVLASAALASKPNERLSDEARGRQLYNRHCASCHGAQAAGDGPVARSLIGGVPDVRETLVDDNRESQVDLILAGRGTMPGYSLSFDRYDARRVWRHMQRAAQGDSNPSEEPE